MECNDWIAELRKACHTNKDMLLYYHPGAHREGVWTCCRRRERSTMGCHPTHVLLTRGKSSYVDIRRRVSASDSGIINVEVDSQKKRGLPKSNSATTVSQTSVNKTKQPSAEGGTTRSTSFVDMTPIMYSRSKKGSSSAALMATKHSGSGGEISDSCITLPVERMEGVKEEEEEKAAHHYGWPHSRSAADLMSNMVVYSPRPTHGHQAQQSKLSNCSYASTDSSPLHLHVNTSWSHLNINRYSSASSAGSQPSLLKKTSCPTHITSGPVPEVDVNHLSERRREMELMTHNVSSLSQPDTPGAPSPQFVKASDLYYSTGEERSCSVPLLDFTPKRMKPAPLHHPHAHHRSAGKRGKEAGSAAVKASPPMISPRISDAQPFIIHL